MINVSSAFREALANDNRAYIERAVITLEDGTVLELGNEQLWGGGFDTDDSVSADESFSALGSAIVNSATLVINNIYDDFSEYVFENAEAVLYIGLELDGNVESIRKGTYIVDGAQYNGSIITLSLLDNMYHFDRPYSESTLEYPATCDTIIRDACTVCGINLSTSSLNFPFKDTVIAKRPDDEATTFREVISYIATICGCFARCDRFGELELRWFDQATLESLAEGYNGGVFDSDAPYSTGDSVDGGTFNPWNVGDIANGGTFTDQRGVHYISSLYNSNISVDDVVITGVQIEYESEVDGSTEKYTELVGTNDYAIKVSGNPLINANNIATIKSRLGTQLIGLKFRKASVTHSSDPTIEAGDVAFVIDRKNNVYPIFITRTNFKVGASQKTVCGASTPKRNSATRYSEQSKTFVTLRKEMKAQKTAYDQALEDLSDRIDNADGLYETQVQQTGGGVITYMHNKPLLADSDIQIMISDVGITVTANGTAQTPTWYGLTVDGQLIASILNTVGINADWINTGQLVIRKNGQEVFFADVDTGTVRISGNSIRITAGDPISSAISTAQSESATYTDQQLADYADQVEDELDLIRDQLDGVVDTYYYDYAPTTSNYPASEWTTEALRSDHEGDLFLDTSTGKSYRWLKENNVWKWKEIPDTASAQALQLAQQAMDTADGKRRVFVSTPYPPYDVGDIWMDSTSGEIMTCTTARTAGSQYVTTDFEKLNDYGEDNAIHLETPFEWSSNGQTANFTAIIYKGEDDVTSDYPDAWFVWTLRTENGESQIATGKTCSVSKSALGYGGTVTCTFTTYETATLATRSLKALNTRSGLTLTTYVVTEGTQPVTELPYKTATEVNLNDYLMGIDAADGYQVSMQDLANRLATSIYDAKYASILNVYTKSEADNRYVNINGGTMTGDLNINAPSAYVRIRATNHNTKIGAETLSSNSSVGGLQFEDSQGVANGWVRSLLYTTGKLQTEMYCHRKGANGTDIYNYVAVGIDASGNPTVNMTSPTAWRGAIGLPTHIEDRGTGTVTLHSGYNITSNSSNILKRSGIAVLTVCFVLPAGTYANTTASYLISVDPVPSGNMRGTLSTPAGYTQFRLLTDGHLIFNNTTTLSSSGYILGQIVYAY